MDVDLDDISLVSVSDVHDNPIAFDLPYELPSGAQIVVHGDGSFTFDASVSRQLDAGLFGSSYEDIRYTIADEHAETFTGGQASFVIDHVNDLHSLSPQTLSLNPSAGAGEWVGQVYVANGEPDDFLYFSILSGNTGNVFAIDSYTGELTLSGSAVPPAGQVFNLVVEVEDFESNGLTTDVTVIVTDNQPPVVPVAQYITAVDLPLTGHVFDDLTGNGQVFDAEGDSLSVVAVNGEAFGVGRTVRLASGAALRLNADGSFDYDPTTSLTLPRLAADDERVEWIEFTTRDNRGATAVSELKIVVGGRNVSPQAFDNHYALGGQRSTDGKRDP